GPPSSCGRPPNCVRPRPADDFRANTARSMRSRFAKVEATAGWPEESLVTTDITALHATPFAAAPPPPNSQLTCPARAGEVPGPTTDVAGRVRCSAWIGVLSALASPAARTPPVCYGAMGVHPQPCDGVHLVASLS